MRWSGMRVTCDAGRGDRPSDIHALRRRAGRVTALAIHWRSRRIGKPRVAQMIEPEIVRLSARTAPRNRLDVASVVAFRARRWRRKHRRRITHRNSSMTGGACGWKERRMSRVRKREIVGVRARASERESARRGNGQSADDRGVAHARHPSRWAIHGGVALGSGVGARMPGSAPTAHSSRMSARR